MATVSTKDADHWATTEDVQDVIKIPQKGSEKDFEKPIQRATDSVQAWYRRETGSADLPDASTLDSLLVQATAYMAAHEAHFSFAWNFRSSDDEETGPGSAKSEARSKFKEWADTEDVTESEAEVEGAMSDTAAQSGSLIDEY